MVDLSKYKLPTTPTTASAPTVTPSSPLDKYKLPAAKSLGQSNLATPPSGSFMSRVSDVLSDPAGAKVGLLKQVPGGKSVVEGISSGMMGFGKQVYGTIQNIGKTLSTPIEKGFKAAGIPSATPVGIPESDLEAKNTAESIGKGAGVVAELVAQPELGLEKLGLSAVIKLAKSGKITSDVAPAIIKAATSKWGQKVAQVISDSLYGIVPEAGKQISEGGFDPSKLALKGAETAVGGQVVRGVGKLAKIGKPIEDKNKVLDYLKSGQDTMTKTERLANESRVEYSTLKGKTFKPSEQDARAAELLKGKITGNAVKDKDIIKNEIKTTGKEVETSLAKKKTPVTAKEQSDIVDTLTKKWDKQYTSSEIKVGKEQIKLFQKQLVGRGGYTTENFYKALKDYESNVVDGMPRGKAALLDPTSAIKLQTASDLRKAVRDLIGAKHPEFKDKMKDLVSLYDVKETILRKLEQLPTGNVVNRALKSTPGKLIGAGLGGAALTGIGFKGAEYATGL